MQAITVKTPARTALVDITREVRRAAGGLGLEQGALLLFVPHTTAGIFINEKVDPAVPEDIRTVLDRFAPPDHPYRHLEGNADAHAKTVLTGSSVLVPVEEGKLVLGTWQAVFFAEFDGPRTRKVILTPLPGA